MTPGIVACGFYFLVGIYLFFQLESFRKMNSVYEFLGIKENEFKTMTIILCVLWPIVLALPTKGGDDDES